MTVCPTKDEVLSSRTGCVSVTAGSPSRTSKHACGPRSTVLAERVEGRSAGRSKEGLTQVETVNQSQKGTRGDTGSNIPAALRWQWLVSHSKTRLVSRVTIKWTSQFPSWGRAGRITDGKSLTNRSAPVLLGLPP